MADNNQQETNLIVTIDGLPCAGKSTLAKKASDNSSYDFDLVPECSRFIGGPKHLPEYPKTKEEAKSAANEMLAIDKSRKKVLVDGQDEAKNKIVDMSPLSNIAFQYAIREENKFDVLEESLKSHEEAYDEGRILRPDFSFYLDTDRELVDDRMQQRPDDPLFSSPQFLDNLQEFYEMCVNQLEQTTCLESGDLEELERELEQDRDRTTINKLANQNHGVENPYRAIRHYLEREGRLNREFESSELTDNYQLAVDFEVPDADVTY